MSNIPSDARGQTTRIGTPQPSVAEIANRAADNQPLKVICPLHGIRTDAEWQRALSDLAATHNWVCRLDRWSYGRFSLLAFFNPWTREAKLRWLRRQYDDEVHDRRLNIDEGQLPSVVAHSFGTYILGYTLLRFDFIRFDKVILCGSILPRSFPWDRLIASGRVQAVRSEFGVRDPWVKRVRWFVRGTGPSGSSGFTCQHDRLVQEEFDYDHGEYFFMGHMEDRWIPFLNRPLVEIPRSKGEPRIPRPATTAPWGLYGLVLTALLMVAMPFARLAIRWERDRHPPPPAPASLAGYVIDAETREPLTGVALSIEDWDTLDRQTPACTTDLAGRFRFDNLQPNLNPAQQVRLIARKPGYEPRSIDALLGSTDYPIKLQPHAMSRDNP